MKTKRNIVIGSVLGLCVLALLTYRIVSSSTSAARRGGEAPLVRIAAPARHDVVYDLHFTGDVAAVQMAGIFAKVNGTLERTYVEIGTSVRAGQILALIDTTELAQQYSQATATYENSRLLFKRNKDLFEQNLVAKQDLDNAEAALKVAKSLYDAAKTRLGYAYITAPFAGIVTKRYLDAGAVVSQNNATLFTLQDINRLKILINVLEKDIPSISIGRPAAIAVDAFPGKTFAGHVARLSEAVDPSTRTMAVEIDIDNQDHTLKPGMFAEVSLPIQTHANAVTVPSIAIQKDERGPFVFVVERDSSFRNEITPGLEKNGETEILTGLDGSKTIIVSGQQFARNRGPVKIER
jgi:RND family efflux transporter MFP subunit